VSKVIVEASAVLVLLNNEPGAEYAERVVVESGAGGQRRQPGRC
jgi:PIN domain nuclease of toxin-antitoxin system